MQKEIKSLARRIFGQAKGLPLRIFIRTKRGLLARFANNGIYQSGFQDTVSYTLHPLGFKNSIFIESFDASDEGIHSTLKMTRLRMADNAVLLKPAYHLAGRPPKAGEESQGRSLPGRQAGLRMTNRNYFPLPIPKAHEWAASAIEEGLAIIRREQASANGYCSAFERMFYLADSRGCERFHPATAFRFGITATKGEAKGYASFYHPRPKKLKVEPLVRQALSFAEEGAREEASLRPGDYECLFSPRAFLELIDPLRRHFDQALSESKKSVFSGQLGKQLFSKHFTLSDNVWHQSQFGVPFDDEGHLKTTAPLVLKGILKGLLAKGHSSSAHLEHPYYPENLVVDPGDLSLEAMLQRVKRGVLLNKIWYHTLMRESTMEVTGLAAAGCLYIENGKIRGRVPHLRYHDSLFSLLRSVAATSKEQLLLKDGEWGAALLPYVHISHLRVV